MSKVLGISVQTLMGHLETQHTQIGESLSPEWFKSPENLASVETDTLRTYSPFALCKILPDLGADGFMNVFAEGRVTCNPETQANRLLQKGFWCLATASHAAFPGSFILPPGS